VKNPFLIGTSLYLRPLEREDAPLVQPWINDPHVTRTLRTCRPISLRAEEAFIERISQSEQDIGFVIVLHATERPIGVTGLTQIDWVNRHAGFGLLIGEKEEWGNGYGTEATRLVVRHAFTALNLNRVWLHVYEYNERALRAYEKVGFKKEGALRQEKFREGRYWDTITMAILREEWEAGTPAAE
jgi:UDP-4-amino-4,6-dideoxy-N-acetyl-beta-L-altrosamine N-acetyltransferase